MDAGRRKGPPGDGKGSWRKAVGWLLLALGLTLLPPGCGREESQEEGDRPAVPVETAAVLAGTIRETVQGIGTLAALKTVEIKPEVSGFIREIRFKDSELVNAGAVLYTLSDQKLQQQLAAGQATLAAARSRLKLAEQTFARRRELVDKQLVSREQFDQAKSELTQARAEVEQQQARIELVREQIADTVLRAPFAGRIAESLVDEGDFVDEGDPLATLYFLTVLEMEFTLPERYSGRVKEGQTVEIEVTAFPEEVFTGMVNFVSPAVNPATRDFLVKARVENQDGRLMPGTFGRAMVVLATREERPIVPEEALVPTREGYQIFVVEKGVARLRDVRIGLREPGRVEILEGARPGDEVVRTGQLQLADGDRVRRVNE